MSRRSTVSSLTRLKLSSGADRAMFIVALGIMALGLVFNLAG